MDHTCPHCQSPLTITPELAGKSVKCGACEHIFTLPALPEPEASPSPPPPADDSPDQQNTLRIFISSPGDVGDERKKAALVVDQLQRWYGDAVHLEILLWEQLPLEIDDSFQDGIDKRLAAIDIAVFILWSRLGTPVVVGDKTYASGTEREFFLMLQALDATGGERPDILFYRRDDDDAFQKHLSTLGSEAIRDCLDQNESAKAFVKEHFWDEHGKNTRAYHSYHQPVEFGSRLKVHLRGLVDKQLSGDDLRTAARWTEGAPYRGLETFHLEHADIFFGREQEVCELENRLRQRELEEKGAAFAVVLGASGSGKSSLARAGLRASLTRYNLDETVAAWRSAVIIPGQAEGDLFGALVKEIATDEHALPEIIGGGLTLEDLAESMREAVPATFRTVIKPALVRAATEAGGIVKLLIIVDQFEEIFTDKKISGENRERFLEGLEALAQSGFCWVVVTMRSDFYPTAQKSETFLRLKGETGQFDLLAPGTDALHRIITEPARMAGLRFEKRSTELGGQSLAGKILEDARNQSDMLPLLSDLLLELYEHRTPENVIPFAAYDAFASEDRNGLEGVLSSRAESVFDSLTPQQQATCQDVLHALVTVEGESDVRRRASLDSLRDTPEKASLVDAFIAARLLTAEGDGAGAQVSLAHEALLRKWDRVADWVTENRQHLRIRTRVEQAMRRWKNKGQPSDLLLPKGLDLNEALSLRNDAPQLIAGSEYAEVKSYIEQSETHHTERARKARAKRRLVTTVLTILTLFALAGAAFGWWQAGIAKSETRNRCFRSAVPGIPRASPFSAKRKLPPKRSVSPTPYFLRRERSVSRDTDWRRPASSFPPFLIPSAARHYQEAQSLLAEEPAYLPYWNSGAVDSKIIASAVSSSGRIVVIAHEDGSLRTYRHAAGTKETLIPSTSDSPIFDLVSNPAADQVAVIRNNTVEIWDLEKETKIHQFSPPEGDTLAVTAFDRIGTILAAAGTNAQIHRWNLGDGSALETMVNGTPKTKLTKRTTKNSPPSPPSPSPRAAASRAVTPMEPSSGGMPKAIRTSSANAGTPSPP